MTVEFDIQPRVLRVGEPAAVTFTVRGAEQAPAPDLPVPPELQVSGPSRETVSQIRFENGRYSAESSIVYRYQLVPLREGTFRVGPLTYRADGQSVEVPAIDLRVVASPSVSSPPSTAAAAGAPALFATLTAEPSSVYHQEVFDLYVSVYSRDLNLGREISLLNLPAAGLELGPFQELPPAREVVGQDVYDVRRFRCKARALTAGSFRLEPTLRVNLLVRPARRRRSLFDDFFADMPFPDLFGGMEQQPVNLQPEPLEIVVRPLPEEGRPENFSGAVGQFSFDVSVKPTDVQVGDPLTITFAIAGSGNLENVTVPTLDLGPDFKVYEPRLAVKDVDPARGVGRLVFEQVVLPRSAQIRELPAISFSYFNPREARYETLARGPFPLTVRAATGTVARIVQAPAPAASARALGADIVYLKPSPARWPRRDEPPWFARRGFLALQAVPALAVAALALSRRRREALARDVARARRQRAPRVARGALQRAERAVKTRDRRAFFEALWSALSSYFGNRLNLAPGEVTHERVLQAVAHAGLSEEDQKALEELLSFCEQERFGAGARELSEKDLRELLDRAHRVLRACERKKV